MKFRLGNGGLAVIDDDMAHLAKLKWKNYSARGSKKVVRQFRGPNGKYTMATLHHEIIGHPPQNMCVIHINGDPFDNRMANLKFVTRSEFVTLGHNKKKPAEKPKNYMKKVEDSGIKEMKLPQPWILNSPEKLLILYERARIAFDNYATAFMETAFELDNPGHAVNDSKRDVHHLRIQSGGMI